MGIVWGRGSDVCCVVFFFFSSRRRHTRLQGDWSSDVCSSDLSKASRRGIRRGFFASPWPVLATRRVESSNALSQSATIPAAANPPAFLRSCLSSPSVSRPIDSRVHCMSLLYGKACLCASRQRVRRRQRTVLQ